ncbi:MAG: MaoC family dehydratase [Rhodospirillaceae bacterium]|nr:MaoC family dehydratase [Rhodospirillaceae bacterium]
MKIFISDKIDKGNFFEDFRLGQKIVHPTPRTVTEGDVSFYTALYGPRFAFNSSDIFAMNLGLDAAPLDDFLLFHIIFGRSVSDISLNAIANLGYASCRFSTPVYPGDTVKATSSIIGLKKNSNNKTGIVWVHTEGTNQEDKPVIDYISWSMLPINNHDAPSQGYLTPELDIMAATKEIPIPSALDLSGYDTELSGSQHLWDDYETGERLDHIAGFTVEESEHQMAVRLYQNSSRVHFDAPMTKDTRFGKRLVYGGHVISIARALSFNGLANAFKVATVNSATHVAPVFAGDTLYAWSEILGKEQIPHRTDLGALRLRTVVCKNQSGAGFPYRSGEDEYDHTVVLDLDYTVLIPT